MNRLTFAFAFGLALLLAATAHAQQENNRETRARELFAVGQYAEALEIYGKLYAETTHPTYMRNIGRCYQNLGQPDKAISSFREYLRQAKELTPDQRAQVEGYIREMEDVKRSRSAPAATPLTPVTAAPGPAAVSAVTPVSAAPPPAVHLTSAAPADGAVHQGANGSSGNATKVLGYSLASAGAAGVVVGGAYFLKTRDTNNQAKALCLDGTCTTNEYATHEGLVADANHQQKIAIVATAVGAAALIGGITLVLLASPERHQAVAHLAPWLGEHGGGVLAVGRF